MNAQRRKRIEEATAQANAAFDELRSIGEEEREAFDNLPESLQGGERGQAMSDAADALESAADDIENAIASLGEL